MLSSSVGSVRIRIRDNKGYLTIKGPSADGGLSRYEWEREISLQDAHDMMLLCEGSIIDKRRYLVPLGNHIIEVDEFYGDNEGLVMAEIELKSIDEEFSKPLFLGRELTGDSRFYNGSLRRYPFKVWGKTFLKEESL